MRPPSYYTSLANSHAHSSSAPYSNRNSSQQLRSSFSSSSSTSYATRTHLPFVPQTMLVAHCYTGSGSSTKPYGQASSSVYSSGSRLGALGSTASSYSPSSFSSRPLSTKRHLLPSSSSSSSSSASSTYAPRSVYLSPGTTGSSSSNYRRSPAYTYQPIRLRERPLLTRISNQISGQRTGGHEPQSEPSPTRPPSGPQPSGSDSKGADSSSNNNREEAAEENWSSDVARNISRNKYLIKFREFDKPRSSIVPDRDIVTVPLEGKEAERENFRENSEGPNISVTLKLGDTKEETTATATMRLPPVDADQTSSSLSGPKIDAKSEPIQEDGTTTAAAEATHQAEEKCDKRPETTTMTKDGQQQQQAEVVADKKTAKEKRNIKLKIKTVKPDRSAIVDAIGAPTVGADERPAVGGAKSTKKKANLEESQNGQAAAEETSPPTKTKVKRLVKKAPAASGEPKGELRPKDSLLTTRKLSGRKVLSPKQVNLSSSKEISRPSSLASEVGSAAIKSAPKSVAAAAAGSSNVQATSKRIRFREYNHDDFNFLSVLGHGGWGFVILAELKDHNNACFAVKCIKKITIVEDDDFDSIMIERKVLTLGNVHPFICKLFCTFETEGYLFFAMEYCAGGDLMFHVQREGKFTEARSRFYAAEIICAIKFLHNQHIIYRDLKLDNILLDSRGHIRLVDFGMCQCRTYREEMLPSNFCGTPEYISPEIIKGVPYNHSVDWWSFGVLLYEMAVGKMPFRGNDENELLWNVCYEQIHYPMFLTKELTSLLQSLLEREPTKRMGMSTCKAGDIYDQAWFKGVDWRAIEELRLPPPFVPDVTSERDVQNFDSDFTQSTPELSPVDESTLKRIDQSLFQKFPYTNPNISIFG